MPTGEPDLFIGTIANPMISETGQVAFRGTLTGPGVNTSNDRAVWMTNQADELVQIVREGDVIDVNDHPIFFDYRTVESIGIRDVDGSSNGQRPSLSEEGQVVMRLSFTDGTEGIFMFTAELSGDLNGDGFVGVDDLNIVLVHWNQNVTPGELLLGDSNGDGFVGVDDLNQVLVNWNNGTPPDAAVIPEPSTLGLLAIGACGLLRHKRA